MCCQPESIWGNYCTISFLKKFHRTTIFLPVAYFVIVSGFLIWHGTWFSPDQFFAVAILIALVLGRSKQFIQDWSVPVILLLSYDYLRGLVPKLTQEANIYPMINFDEAVFGSLPTNSLQSMLYAEGAVRWYDYLGTILYMSHFITPMIIGFIFWVNDRNLFRSYFLALLLLSYLAFFTYIIFPAMPPWMAAQQGIIPEVAKVMDKVFASFARPFDLPSVYKMVSPNLVAAVPSLHAAYPLLTFLFVARKYRAWSLLVLPYVFGIWFSIVYFGEHYVFDIVIGALYALIIFALVVKKELLWGKLSVHVFRTKINS